MKKILFFIGLFLLLVSCSIDETTPTPIQEEVQETKEDTLVSVKANDENFRIPARFASLFDDENLVSYFAWTTAIIVYTDNNNQKITDFSELSSTSTAHIFTDAACYNESKNTIIHLESSTCDREKCTFPLYDNFSLQELVEKDLLNTSF